jgi:hypothetical protein
VRQVLLVLVAVLTLDTVTAQSSSPPSAAERWSGSNVRLVFGPTFEEQDRVVHPIYVPPEPDRGTPAGHGTFEGHSYRVIQYRHHYRVTFSPGLPQDQTTVVRALTMLCQKVAKFDVGGVVPHTTSPPSDDTWVFETRTGPCIGTVFRSTDPHSTVVSIERALVPTTLPD